MSTPRILISTAAISACAAALAAPVAAQAATTVATGKFSGASNHTTKGTVTISDSGSKRTVKLSSGFSASGPVKLSLRLSKSPSSSTYVSLGKMKAKGAQSFSAKKSTSLTKYRYVVVWCDSAGVPIGKALLKLR